MQRHNRNIHIRTHIGNEGGKSPAHQHIAYMPAFGPNGVIETHTQTHTHIHCRTRTCIAECGLGFAWRFLERRLTTLSLVPIFRGDKHSDTLGLWRRVFHSTIGRTFTRTRSTRGLIVVVVVGENCERSHVRDQLEAMCRPNWNQTNTRACTPASHRTYSNSKARSHTQATHTRSRHTCAHSPHISDTHTDPRIQARYYICSGNTHTHTHS